MFRYKTWYAHDEATGRRIAVTNALGEATRYAYDAEGRMVATWGAVYPVKYAYDDYGRMVAMTTYRSGTAWNGQAWPDPEPDGDTTQWLYDEATGLLTNKLYADNMGPSYGYTADGKLATRTWARGAVTEYAYDSLGQLTNINYSGSTPDISFTYDRLGRQATITDALDERTFTYNDALQLAAETNLLGAIVRAYDANGRNAGFALTDGFELDAGLETAYAYDDVGRFSQMSWSGPGNSYTASYAHVESSDMTAGYDIEVGSDTFRTPFDTHLIVYDGWNPVSDIVWSAGYASATTNRYVWGIDLSGTLQGAELARHSSPGATAGGIGGLVAKISGEDAFFATYDANGNVSEYLEEDGDLAAHYEYDPYGNLTASSGTAPGAFEHRFSTKWYDSPADNTLTGDGLYYYGLRFYQPGMGRWTRRDPMGEELGANLCVLLNGEVINHVDPLGLYRLAKPEHGCTPKQVEAIEGAFKEIRNKLSNLSESDFARCLKCIYGKIPEKWGREGSKLLRELRNAASPRPNSGLPIIKCGATLTVRRIIGYTIVPQGETPKDGDITKVIDGRKVVLRPVYENVPIGGEVDQRRPDTIIIRPEGFTDGGGTRCTLLHEMVHSIGREWDEINTTLAQIFCLGRGWKCSAYGIDEDTSWGPR